MTFVEVSSKQEENKNSNKTSSGVKPQTKLVPLPDSDSDDTGDVSWMKEGEVKTPFKTFTRESKAKTATPKSNWESSSSSSGICLSVVLVIVCYFKWKLEYHVHISQ